VIARQEQTNAFRLLKSNHSVPLASSNYVPDPSATISLGHHSEYARLEVGKGGLPPLLPNKVLAVKSRGTPPFPTSNLAWTL